VQKLDFVRVSNFLLTDFAFKRAVVANVIQEFHRLELQDIDARAQWSVIITNYGNVISVSSWFKIVFSWIIVRFESSTSSGFELKIDSFFCLLSVLFRTFSKDFSAAVNVVFILSVEKTETEQFLDHIKKHPKFDPVGQLDSKGFYNQSDDSYFDPEEFYYNPEGYNELGGHYDENGKYKEPIEEPLKGKEDKE